MSEQKANDIAHLFIELQGHFYSYHHYEEGMSAVLTGLCQHLKFEHIYFAALNPQHLKLFAQSQQLISGHQTAEIGDCTSVMEECIDQGEYVQFPPDPNAFPKILQAHAHWAQRHLRPVISMPYFVDSRVQGCLLFEFSKTHSLNEEDVTLCRYVTNYFGPLFQLKLDGDTRFTTAVKNSVRHFFNFSEMSNIKRNVIVGAMVALVFSAVVPIPNQIKSTVRLEGIVQRVLVAPQQGFLQQSYVRPGDEIKAQQLLAELSEDDLRLEQQKKQSEVSQFQNAYGAALASSDRVEMMTSQAKMQEAQSQLDLIEQQIQRTKILAPFDGVVISGDLKQMEGAPVQQGQTLLTVAPKGGYRLVLEVDDRDIDQIKANQSGEVVFVSVPNHPLEFTVKKVNPVAISKEGRNYFEVEGELGDIPDGVSLQPGIDGVAKVEVQSTTLLWKLSHRAVDWFRLKLWMLF